MPIRGKSVFSACTQLYKLWDQYRLHLHGINSLSRTDERELVFCCLQAPLLYVQQYKFPKNRFIYMRDCFGLYLQAYDSRPRRVNVWIISIYKFGYAWLQIIR